jgi:hypothetical protein
MIQHTDSTCLQTNTGLPKRNRHFHNLHSSVEERWKFVSRHSFVTSAPRQCPSHHWFKIFSLHYYANCVSTTLIVLILHNVESFYFFYSNPVQWTLPYSGNFYYATLRNIPEYSNLLMSPTQSNCRNVTKVIKFANFHYNIKSAFISLFTLQQGLKTVENYNHSDKCILVYNKHLSPGFYMQAIVSPNVKNSTYQTFHAQSLSTLYSLWLLSVECGWYYFWIPKFYAPKTCSKIFWYLLRVCKYQTVLSPWSQTKIHTWTCVMVNHSQVMNPDCLCCSPYYTHKQAGQQHKVIKQRESNTCSQICHAIATLTTHSETKSNTEHNYINFTVKFSTLHCASLNLFI